MAGQVFVTGGLFAAAGSAIDQYYGLWDPSTNLPVLADGDPYSDGAYFRASAEATIDLGSGNLFFTPGDEAYKFGGVWTLREEAPMPEHLVLTGDGRIILTGNDHPVWSGTP